MSMRPHERRLLRWAFGVAPARGHHDVGETGQRDRDEQLEVLGVRPAKRRSRSVWTPELEAPLRNVPAVPDLFRDHQPLAGETFDGANQLRRRQTHREKVAGAFAGQDRPRPADAAPVPRSPILVLAVPIADVAAPARTGGRLTFNDVSTL